MFSPTPIPHPPHHSPTPPPPRLIVGTERGAIGPRPLSGTERGGIWLPLLRDGEGVGGMRFPGEGGGGMRCPIRPGEAESLLQAPEQAAAVRVEAVEGAAEDQ